MPSQALSKDERRGAPIFAVIDQPDKHIKDKGYLWIEVRPPGGPAARMCGDAMPLRGSKCAARVYF